MPEKTKNSKRRSTTFCQSKPSKLIKTVAVFIRDDGACEGVWVVCKGKIYKNYYIKYFHNGKTGIVDSNNYRWYGESYNDEQMQEIVRTMNLDNLMFCRPALKKTVKAETEPRVIPRNNDFVDHITPEDDEWIGFYDNVTHFRNADNLVILHRDVDNNPGAIEEILNGNP